MGKSVATNALYDADFLEWTQEQGRLLRSHRFADIDIENLAEEIESVGYTTDRRVRQLALYVDTSAMHIDKYDTIDIMALLDEPELQIFSTPLLPNRGG